MPAISKIRLTNVVYEDGNKRYNDEVFLFDGHNGAIVLENGGGKTVFIHTVLQAVLPHTNLGDRKIKETLQLENAPAHIGIEWIKNDQPRRYVTTCVSLFLTKDGLDSLRYVHEYDEGSSDSLEHIPFVRKTDRVKRPAGREEMLEYYSAMKQKSMYAHTFTTIREFKDHLEKEHHIIANEWESIVKINGDEGGIDRFFASCRTTTDLYDRLLIPTVEDSIMDHNQGMFVDTFEKQRAGFQTYKQLKASIEENEQIQRELEAYVDVFRKFDDKQKAYEEQKAAAKGTWNLLQKQKLQAEKEAEENAKAFLEWHEENETFAWKEASFRIYLEQKVEKQYQTEYEQALTHLEELEERITQNRNKVHSLKYASCKREKKQREELLKEYDEKLAAQKENADLEDYEARLEEANEALHGYFQEQLEKLEKMLAGAQQELQPLEEEEKRLSAIQKEQEREERNLQNQVSNLSVKQKMHQERLHKLKQETLANPDQEDVKTEFHKWNKRHQFLDEEMIRLQAKDHQLDKQWEELEQEKAELYEAKNEKEKERSKRESEETQMQEAHDYLLAELAGIRPKWGSLIDLYLRENSVYQELLELQTVLNREYDELLYQERTMLRFVDDYGEQDIFFSDRFLSKQLHSWKNQLDYLVTGVEFFQSLDADEQENFRKFPLWPLTLITTTSEKQVLQERLEKVKDRLVFPIRLLTLEEAKQAGEEDAAAWIAPAHWETNLDSNSFDKWKRTLKERAREITETRKVKEKEKVRIHTAIQSFEQFFQTYPSSWKEELRDSIRQLTRQIESISEKLKEITEQQEEIRKEKSVIHDTIRQYQDEKNGLETKISKAMEVFSIERDLSQLADEEREISRKLLHLQDQLKDTTIQIDRYHEEIANKQERIQFLQYERSKMIDHEDYQAVKEFAPRFTGEEKETIQERRKDLEFAIARIQQSYDDLITKYEYTKKDIRRIETEMEELLREFPNIDTEMEFPPDGQRQMEQIREQWKENEGKAAKQRESVTASKEKLDRKKGEVASQLEQFKQRFPERELYKFMEDVETIPAMLQEEQTRLSEKHRYLEQEKARFDKELQDIEQAIIQLQSMEEAHHFQSTTIIGKEFSEAELTEFIYKRKSHVKEIIEGLRRSKAEVDKGIENLNVAKRDFRDFCNRTISDVKLKHMALEGIEHKETYEEIVQFQKNMFTRIEQADKYAREYISQNDKDLQAFINNVHNHLLNLTDQLKMIPKRTKVKVKNGWKEIYKFTIPEWTEEDGKKRIRDHMDWILEQLESDRYKTAEGTEDHGLIRKDLEKWFESRQLLQVVMQNEAMKVSCRKVTNDNEVTSKFYSWEQSNNWSGGEKWSKNMTLFLGILNYVAEKKQFITSNRVRHRAVILDNPFGKASSDHVLSPVFFIAEQLGFQIIALTAHAEGKFLQDYFPIIYSCRLRESTDPAKKVMTKEKQLHYAYFQDHEPESLERLGEAEQMELF